MTDQEIKKIIFNALSEQQAFRDLSPMAVASLAIDMVLAVQKKEAALQRLSDFTQEADNEQ